MICYSFIYFKNNNFYDSIALNFFRNLKNKISNQIILKTKLFLKKFKQRHSIIRL
jgi:hypothetical protein